MNSGQHNKHRFDETDWIVLGGLLFGLVIFVPLVLNMFGYWPH